MDLRTLYRAVPQTPVVALRPVHRMPFSYELSRYPILPPIKNVWEVVFHTNRYIRNLRHVMNESTVAYYRDQAAGSDLDIDLEEDERYANMTVPEILAETPLLNIFAVAGRSIVCTYLGTMSHKWHLDIIENMDLFPPGALNDLCSVCQFPLAERWAGLLIPCKHPFDVKCINEWAANAADDGEPVNCPICRSLTTGIDVYGKKARAAIVRTFGRSWSNLEAGFLEGPILTQRAFVIRMTPYQMIKYCEPLRNGPELGSPNEPNIWLWPTNYDPNSGLGQALNNAHAVMQGEDGGNSPVARDDSPEDPFRVTDEFRGIADGDVIQLEIEEEENFMELERDGSLQELEVEETTQPSQQEVLQAHELFFEAIAAEQQGASLTVFQQGLLRRNVDLEGELSPMDSLPTLPLGSIQTSGSGTSSRASMLDLDSVEAEIQMATAMRRVLGLATENEETEEYEQEMDGSGPGHDIENYGTVGDELEVNLEGPGFSYSSEFRVPEQDRETQMRVPYSSDSSGDKSEQEVSNSRPVYDSEDSGPAGEELEITLEERARLGLPDPGEFRAEQQAQETQMHVSYNTDSSESSNSGLEALDLGDSEGTSETTPSGEAGEFEFKPEKEESSSDVSQNSETGGEEEIIQVDRERERAFLSSEEQEGGEEEEDEMQASTQILEAAFSKIQLAPAELEIFPVEGDEDAGDVADDEGDGGKGAAIHIDIESDEEEDNS